MVMQDITEHLVELVKSTSCDLSPDVEDALTDACKQEKIGSAALGALVAILDNVKLSRDTGRPICQDTGTPIFYIWYPVGVSQRKLREQIQSAVRIATERTFLRPNAVEALSGVGATGPSREAKRRSRRAKSTGRRLSGSASESSKSSVP